MGELGFAVQTKVGKWGRSIIELDGNGLYTSSNSIIFQGTLTEKRINQYSQSAGVIVKRRSF